MIRAIICLPAASQAILVRVKSALEFCETKIFTSVDDGFEYLWNEDIHFGLFILQLDVYHTHELLECAEKRPNVNFIAVTEADQPLPVSLPNLSVLLDRKSPDLIEHEIVNILGRKFPRTESSSRILSSVIDAGPDAAIAAAARTKQATPSGQKRQSDMQARPARRR